MQDLRPSTRALKPKMSSWDITASQILNSVVPDCTTAQCFHIHHRRVKRCRSEWTNFFVHQVCGKNEAREHFIREDLLIFVRSENGTTAEAFLEALNYWSWPACSKDEIAGIWLGQCWVDTSMVFRKEFGESTQRLFTSTAVLMCLIFALPTPQKFHLSEKMDAFQSVSLAFREVRAGVWGTTQEQRCC